MTGRKSHLSIDPQDYLPIGDHGLIGNLHTAALVGRNGSIDWYCLPRFDASSVFAGLLDRRKGGFFRIAPDHGVHISDKQIYLPDTNILLTRFLAADGMAELTDFMPIDHTSAIKHQIIRSLSVIHGSLPFRLMCRPSFNYARETHNIKISPEGAIFSSKDLTLGLTCSPPLEPDGQGGVQASFTLHAGQTLHFQLEKLDQHDQIPHLLSECEFEELFQQTLRYWRGWLSQCQYQGRWREMVHRSALVLKLLTYQPTGAIVAAPTTSLPESIGGARNWDYRYSWLRDAAFSLDSLLTLGFTQEAEKFMQWLDARCHECSDTQTLQPMYGINGEHDLREATLDHLEGYCQSQPVRIGNGAYRQTQLDIYGELMEAICIYNRYEATSYDLWCNLVRLLEWLAAHWQDPDKGLWEIRGAPKPFVHSRMMSWVAFDRALRIADQHGWPAPTPSWSQIRRQIYEQVMQLGWNEQQQSFVQYYGSHAVDAGLLLMPITRFTGPREPRTLSTIKRIQKELTSGVLVRRYDPQQAANDGVGDQEGMFGACSFWLVEDLALAGRLDEARLLLEKLFSYSNHLGLYAEEISSTGQALGNFPQALTHLALITACTTTNRTLNKRQLH